MRLHTENEAMDGIGISTSSREHGLSVLWATDGSAGSDAAIPVLKQVVQPCCSELRVITVVPQPLGSGARPDPAALIKVTAASRRRAMAAGQAAAEHQAKLLQNETTELHAEAVWGTPIKAILREAARADSDLIVMGAKGQTNLSFLLLGSVSNGVVQHSPLPVFLARPGHETIRRVLVAYDGSTVAKHAVRFLSHLALARDTEVIVSQVVEPFTVPGAMPIGYRNRALTEAHRINQHMLKRAVKSLEVPQQLLTRAGYKACTEVLIGEPAAELLRSAKSHAADLVVVASRKPSPARHYLLGSTAEKLVRHTEASVLVVR
jgi:nucleotide-binding universal stress UspA family protein